MMFTPRAGFMRNAAALAPILLLTACAAVRPRPAPEVFPWSYDRHGQDLAAAPEDTQAIGEFLRGELALKSGDREEALDAYEKAAAADPNTPMLRHRLALLYVRSGRLTEGQDQCVAVLQAEPASNPRRTRRR